MAGKVYSAEDIMKMAVGLIDPDIDNADYNGDGKITADDARTNNRISAGLSVDSPVVGNSGVTQTGGNKNIYAASNAYQNQADAVYKGLQEQISAAGKKDYSGLFSASDAYQKQADDYYAKIQATPDFSYDFNEDAVFQALREQYMKDGRLASEHVAGQAAALSGGYGNSYGATAAGQAYMGAIDDLYDKIPELENAAYQKYQNKRNADLQNWQILQDRAAAERGYAESERAYQNDRDAYLLQLALQNYDILQGKADAERGYAESERAYQDSRDAYLWELALQKAQYGDYSGLKGLGVDTSAAEYDTSFSKALQLAQLGDYSALQALGVDTSGAEYDTSFNKALQLAQLGDYSALQALGIDTSTAQKQNELDFALAAAEVGDYSFLKALGIDTSSLEAPKASSYSGSSGEDYTKKKDETLRLTAEEYEAEGKRLLNIRENPSYYGAAISGDAGKKLKALEEEFGEVYGYFYVK